jgi:heptaprenyl diphosphate synthase
LKTAWILLAVAINAIEFFIPRIPFFPWLKPGLANCVTIIWIVEFGVVDAILFTLLRIWITGFYFGFSFLTISLSLSGGLCSTAIMGLLWLTLGKRGISGAIGTGILGALVHNITQITVIYFLFAKNTHIFYQVPLMIFASVVFGGITGAIAPALLNFLINAQKRFDIELANPSLPQNITMKETVLPIVLLAASCAIVFVNSMAALALCAITSTVFVQALSPAPLKGIMRPLNRFWLMFAFIACVYLFLSYGTKIEGLPFLTYEGVRLTVMQWLRLWTWLELSFILTHFKFHNVVLHILKKAFPNHKSALYAGILSLEYFPAALSAIQRKFSRHIAIRILRHPFVGMQNGLEYIYREVITMITKTS